MIVIRLLFLVTLLSCQQPSKGRLPASIDKKEKFQFPEEKNKNPYKKRSKLVV